MVAPNETRARVLTAVCSKHGRVQVTKAESGSLLPSCGCGKPEARGRSHYNATPTECGIPGHPVHRSKTEARVCFRVHGDAADAGLTVYRSPRIPCFNVAPDPSGQPCYVTPDFALVRDGQLVRLIDAKSGAKRSPEWKRGRAMVEAQTGIPVEEVTG